jgi:predicted MFS family arabinose efflux permease
MAAVADPVLRDRARDFRLFWVAGAASEVGSHASALVLPLLVLSLGGSPVTAGLLATAAGAVLYGLGPVAGVYADRWPRRTMMSLSALVAAALVGVVAVGAATGTLSLPVLFGLAAAEGAAAAAFAAAASGSLRRLLPADHPERGLAALQARQQGVELAGSTLGGLLFQLAAWVPFAVDAVSYAVAAACTRRIGSDLRPEREAPAERARPLADLAAGLRYVGRQPFLRFLVVWSAGVNLAFGVLYFHVVLAARLAGAAPAAIGVVLTVATAAGLAGALLAPRLLARVRPATVVVTASWLLAAVVVPLALVTATWAYALLLGVVSLVSPAVSIVFQSRAVTSVPDGLQGRVGTALRTFGEGAAVLAPVTAGALVAAGTRAVPAVAFGGTLALLAAYATANVRHLRPAGAR